MGDIQELPPPRKRKGPLRELLETLVLAVIIAFTVRTFGVEVYRVQGTSMESTLHTGERVLVNKFVYRYLRQPEPGDVIVFRYPRQPDRDFIKRVVAVAGDRVEIKEGKVSVNGKLFPEAPGVLLSDEDSAKVEIVPPDSVYVLGDNRNNSEDSRWFGEVPLENIRGPAFLRIWPLGRVCHFVNPVKVAASASKDRGFWGCP